MRRKKREPRGRTQDRDDRIMEEKETRTEEVKNSEVEKSEPGDVQNPEIKPGKTGWKKRPAVSELLFRSRTISWILPAARRFWENRS